ncbi:tumor necrosis factor receptor superfamily member 14-like isoform X2 [Polyodon spathula]|uniref:tumor necrosis factor receptor superfamily member 14-like isoform X2 n=1 Tax=Polyodon spathula TaxID=7913 RepID=UPI001B7ED682|nr:tumor necrosis factor receptor superfamily member 14-like isoform X2 [Polyodon spathula]
MISTLPLCSIQIIALLVVSLSIASACRPDEYHFNGQCCSLCETGSHVSQHCTALQKTECTHCSNGTYIDRPNWLTECRSCKVCDSDLGLFVRHQCSLVKNTVCSCLKEFFCLDRDGESCQLCRKRRVCQPGQRVKQQGSENSDTVCEDCPKGTFSIEEMSLYCAPWTVCKSGGKNGNSTTDVVCEEEAATPWTAIAVVGALLLFGLLIGIGFTTKKTNLLQRKCCANHLTDSKPDAEQQPFSP